MAEVPGKKKRRPVDALFGEDDAPALPSYVVEAPQPVTTVSPPPPAPARARAAETPDAAATTPAWPPGPVTPAAPAPFMSAPPAPKISSPTIPADDLPPTVPAFASAPAVEAPPAVVPAPIKIPAPKVQVPRPAAPSAQPPVFPDEPTGSVLAEPIGSAPIEPTVIPAPPASTPPPPVPTPIVMSAALYPSSTPDNRYASELVLGPAAQPPSVVPEPTSSAISNVSEETKHYFAYMPDTIRQLYNEVNDRLSDSPTVGDYCMKTLMLAREAYIKEDYATAEYYIETVDAKLHRSSISMQASRSPKILLLYFWEFFMLFVSAVLIAVTYVANLSLLGLAVAPEFGILLRAIGWGGVGGVIGALYNLPWFIQFREYDPAYNMNYFVRPLQGFLIGGVLFLLSQAGILAGSGVLPGLPTAPGQVPIGPVFLYILSALAGFKQEYVWEFFDNILKAIFRIPTLPTELNTPVPPPNLQPKQK